VKQKEHRWLEHYLTLQQELSALVSPQEAAAARRLTHSSLTALLIGVVAIVMLGGLAFVLHAQGHHVIAEQIAVVAPLAVTMLLISRWRVLWAGRIALVTAAVFLTPYSEWFLSMPLLAIETKVAPALDNYSSALFVGNQALFAVILGWLVDAAAATDRRGSKLLRWQTSLSVFAIGQCAVLWSLLGKASGDDGVWVGFVVRTCLLLLWCWFLHPRFADPSRYQDSDTSKVFMLGMTRWGRRLVGRALAVASLIVIGVATLNGFALPQAFELDGPTRAVIATLANEKGAQPSAYAFFVPKLGRLLRTSDFDGEERRWYRTDNLPADLGEELNRLKFYGDHEGYLLTTATHWNELAGKLEPWRINSAAEFVDYCASRPDLSQKELHVWALETPSASSRDSRVHPETGDFFIVDLQRASRLLLAGKVDEFLTVKKLQMGAAAIFASFAFVILWRRGGDSKAARWIGIWLASAAMSFALPLIGVVYESTFIAMANAAQARSIGVTLNGLFYLLLGFGITLFVLTISSLTYWMIYRHTRLTDAGRSAVSPRLRDAINGRSVIVAGTLLSLIAGTLLSHHFGEEWLMACITSCGAVAMLALNRIRHRYLEPPDTVDARFGFTRSSYLLAALAVGIFMTAPILDQQSRSGGSALWPFLERGGLWLAIGVLALFVTASTLFILRTDWLRLSAGRNLSWLATAFALPLMFEFTNNSLPGVFESLGIFLPEAAGVASVLVVVALLQPLQKGLELIFETVSSPVTRDLRRRLDGILEAGVGADDDNQMREKVEALLRSYGIERYALWIRQRGFAFAPIVDHLSAAERVTLSESLCAHLAKVRGVIDIESVHSEWKHFFDQFELHRLASILKGRYLYAVPLGRSLWGLLVLEDSAASTGIARHMFAEIANEIGVALSLKRR